MKRVMVEIIVKGKRVRTSQEHFLTGQAETSTREKANRIALERVKNRLAKFFPSDAIFRVYH